FSVGLPRPPQSTLFPYTPLFRSDVGASEVPLRRHIGRECDTRAVHHDPRQHVSTRITNGDLRSNRYFQGKPEQARGRSVAHNSRSEEHTSELQSRENLVCRLLLE